MNTAAAFTLLPREDSWFVGANVPGKPRASMPYVGGFAGYGQEIDAVAAPG